jgi:predicted outer membrane repeat protein
MRSVRVLILAAFALGPAARGGTIIYVDDDACPGPGNGTQLDPYCSIQVAIGAAAGGDEIVVAEGTYLESIDFDGKAITLRSTDPANPAVVAATVVNGNGATHVVLCNSGEGAGTVLDGLTITGGAANGAGADGHGAGMYCLGSPTVSRCVFTSNHAVGNGGGLYSSGGNPAVTGCTFSFNTSVHFGGGVYAGGGTLTATGCTFTGNAATTKTALGGEDAVGGALYIANAGGTVTGCSFTSNLADDFGGAIWAGSGIAGLAVNVSNCTFTSNEARIGGAVSLLGQVAATISDCTFTMNAAVADGGAMRNSIVGAGTLALTACVFDLNTAGQSGGGLTNSFNPADSTTVSACTFSGNIAPNGGAIFNASSSPALRDCAFSGNQAVLGGGMNNNVTSHPSVTNCLFTANTAGLTPASAGDFGHGGGMSNAPGSTATITNCTFTGNSAIVGGGGVYNYNTGPSVTNSILWGNAPDQVVQNAGDPALTHCDVQGGFPGAGNIDADPLFADGDGRLSAGSPAIDAGLNAAPGLAGITSDLDGNSRFVDDPATPDCPQAPGACGAPPVVDMGAYESSGGLPCPWDCDDSGPNGDVGITDFLDLLFQWGSAGTTCDLGAGQPGVGIEDFLDLLLHWGPCP